MAVNDGGHIPCDVLPTLAPKAARSYGVLKEMFGPFWLVEEQSPPGSRCVGALKKGDALYLEHPAKFKQLGDFNSMTGGFVFVETVHPKAASGNGPTLPLRFVAWEPVTVYLVYHGLKEVRKQKIKQQIEALQAEVEAGDKNRVKAAQAELDQAQADLEAVEALDPHEESRPWINDTTDGGGWWLLDTSKMQMPKLLGTAGQPEEVRSRSFHAGQFEIPAHTGPEDPPLVFIRPRVFAETPTARPNSPSNHPPTPCEVLEGRIGERVFNDSSGHLLIKTEAEAEDNGAAASPEEGGEKDGPLVFESVGEFSWMKNYYYIRPPTYTDSIRNEWEKQLRIEMADPIHVYIVFYNMPPQKDKEDRHADTREWIKDDGWKPTGKLQLPVLTVGSDHTRRLCADEGRYRLCPPGELKIKGAGDQTVMLFFWKRAGDTRPDLARDRLMLKPWLLPRENEMSIIFRRLRHELGDPRARDVAKNRFQEWAVLYDGDGKKIETFMQVLKMEVLSEELGGLDLAKQAAKKAPRIITAATAPQMTDRCRVLREFFGEQEILVQTVERLPEVLTRDASELQKAMKVLEGVFTPEAARSNGEHIPRLLLNPTQLESMFATLDSSFYEVWRQRLRERTLGQLSRGEWAKWVQLLDKPPEEVHAWIGRIRSEEQTVRTSALVS